MNDATKLIREYVQWFDNRQRWDYGFMYPSGWIEQARKVADKPAPSQSGGSNG